MGVWSLRRHKHLSRLTTVTMQPASYGFWNFLCHFNTHLSKGMEAIYIVYPEGECPLTPLATFNPSTVTYNPTGELPGYPEGSTVTTTTSSKRPVATVLSYVCRMTVFDPRVCMSLAGKRVAAYRAGMSAAVRMEKFCGQRSRNFAIGRGDALRPRPILPEWRRQ